MLKWKSMKSAPKDRPILAWCEESEKNKAYNHFVQYLGSGPDGWVVVKWVESKHPDDGPDWWFEQPPGPFDQFEVPVHPIAWLDLVLPAPPPEKK